MKHLYVSDLDGTLLGPNGKVSDESVRMLNAAIRNGALISVATARTPATVSKLMAGIKCPLPYVVMTGAAIWDHERGRYLYPKFHKPQVAEVLVETYRQMNLSTFIYTLGDDQLIHIYHIGDMSELEHRFIAEREDSPFKVFEIVEGKDILPKDLDKVLLFYAMRPTEEVEPVYRKIKENPDLKAVYYHDIYGDAIALMEVFGPGVSKAEAIKMIASDYGADRVTAYGDNVNDLPMLGMADDAVVVANGVEEVRRVAGRIIGSNSEDAVARDILEHSSRET